MPRTPRTDAMGDLSIYSDARYGSGSIRAVTGRKSNRKPAYLAPLTAHAVDYAVPQGDAPAAYSLGLTAPVSVRDVRTWSHFDGRTAAIARGIIRTALTAGAIRPAVAATLTAHVAAATIR